MKNYRVVKLESPYLEVYEVQAINTRGVWLSFAGPFYDMRAAASRMVEEQARFEKKLTVVPDATALKTLITPTLLSPSTVGVVDDHEIHQAIGAVKR